MARIDVIDKLIDGRYQIVSLIGEGGMGAVYCATDTKSGQQVALKVINDEEVAQDEVLVARFEREAKAGAKVRSPHIVEALGAGHDADTGHPYMVMELLEGENAAQLSKRLGPLPPELAVRIGAQTCLGLAAAHAQGVVHRDIKPANLFLAKVGGGELVVKLLDFGVAKFKMDQATESDNQSLTRTGSMLGSPMYMSPEQARGLKSIDQRADIWSLGIVMHELLSSRSPYAEVDGLGELIITICTEPPARVSKPAPWVSGKLADVVAHALQLVTSDRYQSAEKMGEALSALLPDRTDLRIDESLLVPLDAGQRSAATGGGESAGDDPAAFGDTVLLDDAPAGGGQAAPPPSMSDVAKTLVMDREADEPTVPRPAPGGADDADNAALARHRQALLDAARLEPGNGKQGAARRGGGVMVIVVMLLLVVAAAAAYLMLSRRGVSSSATAPSAASALATATALPPADLAPPAAPAPSLRAAASAEASVAPSAAAAGPARLAVNPPTAGVAIAGRRTPVKDGYVKFDAPLGKTVLVTVTAEGKSTTVAVKMTDHGPVPAQVGVTKR